VSAVRRCLVFPSFGVPLACLSIALFAPTPVRAGCDYPTHIEHPPVPSPSEIPMAPKSETRGPSQPCPCTGPHCSRQPLAPTAPTSIESVKMVEWAYVLPHVLLTPSQKSMEAPETAFSLPMRPPSAIYHPPRLAC
jgi:hypothetical protein